MATSARCSFRGCNHSVMFRPASLLATQVAPTTVMLHSPSVDSLTSSFLSVSRRVPHLVESWTYPLYTTEQPWRFLPNNSRFVTSPSPGYASRLNRAIDDRGFSPHKIHSLVGCPLTVAHKPPRGFGVSAFASEKTTMRVWPPICARVARSASCAC